MLTDDFLPLDSLRPRLADYSSPFGLGQEGRGKSAKRGSWVKPMHDSTAYDLKVRIGVGSVFTDVETLQLFLGGNP